LKKDAADPSQQDETPSTPSPDRPRLVILTAKGIPDPHNLPDIATIADVVVTDAHGLADSIIGAHALLLWDYFSPALQSAWSLAGKLEWIHVAAAGVNDVLFKELRQSDVVVTNARGVFDGAMAEFVLASIMANDKQLHVSKDLQRSKTWQSRDLARTAGSQALVIGTGSIGRAVARLLRAVGMDVQGVGRTARDSDPDFGRVLNSADLVTYVGKADHLIAVAPLTDETRGMIGSSVLSAMKPTAHLVNVGRGALVDEQALEFALKNGVISAASLDVFIQEPLPKHHPFWMMNNVHISAHLSGDVVGWRNVLADQFLENLEKFVLKEPVPFPVDKIRGYVSSAGRGEPAQP
jgi:phosphoglycerate dehydrogenase-like enzyme